MAQELLPGLERSIIPMYREGQLYYYYLRKAGPMKRFIPKVSHDKWVQESNETTGKDATTTAKPTTTNASPENKQPVDDAAATSPSANHQTSNHQRPHPSSPAQGGNFQTQNMYNQWSPPVINNSSSRPVRSTRNTNPNYVT